MSSGDPVNPYAPPVAELSAPEAIADPTAELASLGQRLGGALFDSLMHLLAMVPIYLSGLFLQVARLGRQSGNPFYMYTHTGRAGTVSALLVLALMGVQAVLLTTRGQSIGKIVAGSRVVRTDGTRAPFLNVFVVRHLLAWLIAFVPKVGPFISIADVVLVFGAQRRCLHDRVAGTKVVKARAAT
jgi:uncharacterized RDD family membrane protein YckC